MLTADLLKDNNSKDSLIKTGRGYPYKNLVLEGGGILGIAYCGVLEELHKRGLLAGIKNYAGSSAGSIVAGALACGASFNFLAREMAAMDFASFIDYGNKLRAVYNLYYYNGICPGDVFMKAYGELIYKLTGNADITLRQIHEKYGGRLVITATSTNTRKIVYFDYRSHPDLPLKLAVRMSMSIPFMFIPVQYAGDTWVDGGVLDNFPMKAFHRKTLNDDRINPKTLGLMLMTATEETANYPKVTGFWTYINSLFGCYMTQTQKMYLDPQDWVRTVKIHCGKVSGFDFFITAEDKERLVEAGRRAVIDYFAKSNTISQCAVKSAALCTGHRVGDDTQVIMEKNSEPLRPTLPIDIPSPQRKT